MNLGGGWGGLKKRHHLHLWRGVTPIKECPADDTNSSDAEPLLEIVAK